MLAVVALFPVLLLALLLLTSGLEGRVVGGPAFVGPAGRMLDQALEEAGIERELAYVTNVVKHFKFERRGKLRLHKKPNAEELTGLALEAAVAAGAGYADARWVRQETDGLTVTDDRVDNLEAEESSGLGIRGLVKGRWGFAASAVLDP